MRLKDYLIVDVLGQGGMGRVFAAVHALTGRQVAVKTVLSQELQFLDYFQREIAALQSLAHPGVVPLRDHGVHEGRPWYAMDLLSGTTLRDLLPESTRPTGYYLPPETKLEPTEPVQPEPPGSSVVQPPLATPVETRRATRDELLSLCIEVLQILDYVHSRGVVHGDLKPENIFVVDGSRPVLVDFGLASSFDCVREAFVPIPRAIGSVAYMAPEQVRGNLADARADLYALGCILYECLTGTSPFLRSTIEATRLAHLRAEVVPPSLLAPNVSRQLDELTARLLAKSPVDRPGYASEVARALSCHVQSEPASGRLPGGSGSHLYRPVLVGREKALKLLRERVDDAVQGRGSKLLICGETGIGKTRLLLEAVDAAGRADMAVFHVNCRDDGELSGRRPFGPLALLLSALRDYHAQRAAHDSPAVLKMLDAAALLSRKAARDAAPAPASTAQRDALLDGLVEALLGYCSARPCLLAADDQEAGDELTRQFLRRLIDRNLAGERLLLVCTEGADAGDASLGARLEKLTLAPLGEEEVALSIRSMLAVEHPSPTLISHVHRLSEGNPLLVGQYVRGLIESKELVRKRHEGWYLATTAHTAQPLTHLDTAGEMFSRRIASLPEPDLHFASIAATVGRAFHLPTLSAITGLAHDLALKRATQLCARHVLALEPSGQYRFTHARLFELLRARVPAGESRRIHRRAARVLARSRRNEPAAAAGVAEHFAASDQPRRAAVYFEAAARYLAGTHCYQDAVQAFEAALEQLEQCAPPSGARRLQLRRVSEALGDVALVLRQFDRAAGAFARVLALAGDDVLCVARQHRKIAAANQRNRDVALLHLRTAIALLESVPEDRAGRRAEWLQAHLDLMFVHYWKQETKELLAIARKISELVAGSGSPEQLAAYHFNMAAGLMQSNRYVTGPEELRHIEQALAGYRALEDGLKTAMCRFLRALILLFSNDLDAAQEGFEALLALGEKTASVTIQLRSLTYLSLLHRRRRAKERVRRLAASALALSKEHQMSEYEGTAWANLAWIAWSDGEFEECTRMARTALAAWQSAPLDYPFCWMALLPLLGVEAANPGTFPCGAPVEWAARMLDQSQQLLPGPVWAELECLRNLDGTGAEDVRTAIERVVHAAVDCTLM